MLLCAISCWSKNYIFNIFTGRQSEEWPPPCDCRRPRLVGESLPVVTACHPRENGVLAWTVYAVIGLWLSGPGLQDREAVVSVISSTWMPVGGPGGPDRWYSQWGKRRERQINRGADRGAGVKEGGWVNVNENEIKRLQKQCGFSTCSNWSKVSSELKLWDLYVQIRQYTF